MRVMIRYAIVGFIPVLLAATEVRGEEPIPRPFRGTYDVITNSVSAPGRARQDTLYLMGTGDNGDGDHSGRFENEAGIADWHGWTHFDVTAPTETHWHVSTYWGDQTGANPGPDNHVAYCGDETIASCGPGDPVGGYGNDWIDHLDWMGTAPDDTQPTIVAMDYHVSYDNEPDYDYLYFKVLRQDGWEILRTYNGLATNVHEVFEFSVGVVDYVGPDSDQIHLRFELISDVGWSDEDCRWPTHGAAQIDDVAVSLDGEVATYDDFESKTMEGNWFSVLAPGVGDFAQLMNYLTEIDECVDNFTYQAIFIDDGIVVPELPGTECITWCYGPGGWIVNNTGGLAGPDRHLLNRIVSPVHEWPAGNYEGATLRFDRYHHEELGDAAVWPGMFYQWGVRSVDTGNPDDLEGASWNDRNYVYYGGPGYSRHDEDVSVLLVSGRTHVQWMLQVIEYGWAFGWNGVDGTPGPYFDNVAFLVYSHPGPAMATRELDLAQDTFPERGSIDYGNLQVNWCRFDMALDINNHAGLDPGDSIAVMISSLRAGADFTQDPRIFYKIKTNPLFDGVRGDELGTPDGNGIISGSLPGSIAMHNGTPSENFYAFDLPDTGVFYPGDQLHYYVWAEDAVDGAEIQHSTLPADISRFDDFDRDLAYDRAFSVHFLPTMFSATPGDQPRILFWDDTYIANDREWHTALRNNGFLEGIDWDIYCTGSPGSFVGDGLGSRATPELLQYYDILLYSSGTDAANTISPPDPDGDEGDDTGVLAAWFEQGDKNAFFTGDNLARDLQDNDVGFLNTWLSVDLEVSDVRSFIDNQTAPIVLAVGGANPVFSPTTGPWVADGGCPGIDRFDGVAVRGNAEWIAEFANPQGQPGGYAYPAATYHADTERDNQVVYMPYDLMHIGTPHGESRQGTPAPLSARARVLRDILLVFGLEPGPAVDVPGLAGRLETAAHPNPFNPKITITFTLPRPGEVSVNIYTIRGELVRTVIDGARFEAGDHPVVWEGDDDSGRPVASGVYFYEVQASGQRRVGKMALVK